MQPWLPQFRQQVQCVRTAKGMQPRQLPASVGHVSVLAPVPVVLMVLATMLLPVRDVVQARTTWMGTLSLPCRCVCRSLRTLSVLAMLRGPQYAPPISYPMVLVLLLVLVVEMEGVMRAAWSP